MEDILSFGILGLVQGLTEFLPVSSTGHLILAREFFDISAEYGLAVDAVLQLSTALAVIVYFAKDLGRLTLRAFEWVAQKPVPREDTRLIVALLIGTVPAVVAGFFLEGTMETMFRSATLVAYALLAGSAVMLLAELLVSKRNGVPQDLSTISASRGLLIGLFQALALVPGMSRSGMTISGGLFLGLSRESAARFGFLLSVPIILGSGLKKLLELEAGGALSDIGGALFIGSVASFIAGLAAIHVLLLFVRSQPLYLFIVYRIVLAVVILALI
jgi:undecaprenyl-diphosphatase